MKGWQSIKLEKLVTNPITYGVVKPGTEDTNGVKLIRGGDVLNGKINSNLRTITQEISDQYKRTVLEGGELIVSLVGNPGEVAIVPAYLAGANLARQVGLIRLLKGIESKFVKYYLMSAQGKEQLYSSTMGSVQQVINLRELKIINIPVPPLPEQKAIAEVLSSLDDKIDLLHRQNKTLEVLAETIFRKWFVEEAKPEWPTKPLNEYFPVFTGKKDANYSSNEGSFPFFTCAQEILKAPDYSYEGHAILLAGNGDFNLKRYKGKFEAYQRTYVLIPKNEAEVGFLYYALKYYLDDITMGHRGSVINFITKGMIADFKLAIMRDDNEFMDKCAYFTSINERVDANGRQIETLVTLRDTLLPKLMAAEIRVEKL